jgi:PmbA protein
VIGPLLDAAARQAERADAVLKSDATLTLALSPEGEPRVWAGESQVAHLRVMREGRIGYASSGDPLPEPLRDRALAAVRAGPVLELHLPRPAPLPEVAVRAPQAVAADVAVLERLARALFERLQRSHRRVEVWAERSVGAVQVGNTRGVLAGYEVTLAGAGAVVESIGAGYAPPCRVHTAGAGLPELADLEAVVEEVDRRLDPPLLAERPTPGSTLPVCLAPRAVAGFLRPLRAALLGREAPGEGPTLRERMGERVFDPKLTLTDDPLAPWRPGSRPVDDDGVVSRRVTLIERGRIMGLLSDLETGARAGTPSTGHGWRRPGAGSRVGFTNLRIAPGVETRATLLTMMGRGLLVEELEWRSGPNPARGTLHAPAPWTYLVENGRVKGRLEGVRLGGDVFAALSRIVAVGSDATWVGAVCSPSILLEGLTI